MGGGCTSNCRCDSSDDVHLFLAMIEHKARAIKEENE